MSELSLNAFITRYRNNREKSYGNAKLQLEREFQAKKLGKIYSLHRYWTKQPINVIEHFILELTEPEDLVLDPFCGVGTTGVGALKHGRIAILLDLSPVAVFLARNYVQQLSDEEMKLFDHAFQDIIHQVSRFVAKKQLYRTSCRKCGKIANVRNYIYTEIYACPACEADIYFCQGKWEEISARKRSKNVTCRSCGHEHERKALRRQFIRFEPIALRYTCQACFGLRKVFSNLSAADCAILEQPISVIRQNMLT
ncbi:MAG: DNA methyltransferase [Candidatus Odinarchaeota archaeon]